MKITRLRLQNLASLAQEQIIDFESAPLANAGLIAITGKTGAGKSTLLDAMCLALFDQVPRLHGALGTLTDASGQGMTLKDPKHILRRGCTFGCAEVDFIALDQKRYRAYWEVRRARQKVDGKLKHDRAVTCLEDGRVLTQKISECTPCIQELIGLTFEQFSRAVLLAQSEVGAFLKAKDQERADLLEYLTNSNIFSLVSQRSFEKTKAIRYELDRVQDLAGHVKLLSIEEKQQLHNEKQQLERNIDAQLKSIKQLEQAEQWFQKYNLSQSQLDHHLKQQQQLMTVKTSIDEKNQQLIALSQFSDIRHRFEAIQQAEQHELHVQQQISIHQQQFQAIQQQFKQQQQRCAAAEHQIKQHEQQLNILQPVFQQGFALDAQREQLLTQFKQKDQDIQQKTLTIGTLNRHIGAQEQQLKTLEQQQEHLSLQLKQYDGFLKLAREPNANLEKLKRLNDLWKQLIESGHSDIVAFEKQQQLQQQQLLYFTEKYQHIDQFEQQCQKQYSQLNQQQKIKQHADFTVQLLEQLAEQYQLKADYLLQLDQFTTDIAKQEQIVSTHETQFQHAEQQLLQLQHLLQQQDLLKNDYVEKLRAQLQPDQACFVCGSTSHPFVSHHDMLDQAFSAVQQQQLDTAQQHKKAAFEQWQHSKQTYTALSTQYSTLIQQHAELSDKITLKFEQISRDIQQINTDIQVDQPFEQLQQQFLGYCATLEQRLQQQTELHEANQKQLIEFKQHLAIQAKQQQIAVSIQELQQLEQHILMHLDCEKTKHAWPNAKADCIQHCLHAIPCIVDFQTQLQQQQEQIHHIRQQLLPQKQDLHSIEKQVQEIKEEISIITNQGQAIALSIQQLIAKHTETTYKTTQAWFQAVHDNKKEMIAAQHAEAEQLQHIQQQYEQQKRHLDDLQQQHQVWQQQKHDHQQAKETWLAAHPEFDDALVSSCLGYQRHQILKLQQEVDDFNHQMMLNNASIERLTHDLATHEQSRPECEAHEIAEQRQKHQAELDHAVERKDILQSQLLSDQTAQQQQQAYLKEIEQLQAQVHRWHKISELIGSREGNKFQKIAQEHHLDILVEYANQQLQPLSQRYQLKRIPDSLGLAIIDQDMNSEIRPVLSLSGGETFLVSLALALAIANMASGAMKLESLFIDEGFGTLDPTSLHIVMNALDRLQSQGRKVVLISHVQEMHERIPTQIRVEPVAAGTSQITVVG